MKLKALFQRMREDFEIKCDKDTFDVCSFDIMKRKKVKIDLRKHIEFVKYLDELRDDKCLEIEE